MSSREPIRCIIVDDEPLAVTLLADYVRKTPGLTVVLQTTSVLEALQAVQEGRADLVFLDIQMPELTGIQFMRIIRQSCKVIVTTAYAQYAVEGYEHDVVDYLLKPITLDRFMIAVQKARGRIGEKGPSPDSLSQEVRQMPGEPGSPGKRPDYIFIRTEYRIQKINLEEILFIEALRDYIAIHTRGEKVLSLDSMKNMEETLPAEGFVRIHKSYIVNKRQIDFIERSRVVIGQQYLPVGDTYREKFLASIGMQQ